MKTFKVNNWYITLYAITLALNCINVSWTTGGNNQTASVFAAKFDWTAKETQLNNSMINFASQIGKALGAVVGGKLILKGRMRVFIIYNILSILACLMMQVLDVRMIIAGKFLHGVFVTIVHIVNCKMIMETIPQNLTGKYSPSIPILMTFGYMLTCAFGIGLPERDYNPELAKIGENKKAYDAMVADVFWRFIYFFPIMMNVIMLSVFAVFIKTDSIMFNLSVKDEEEALKLIDRVYHKSEDRMEILRVLKTQVYEKPKSNVPYCEQLFGRKNRAGTFILMLFTCVPQY